MLVPSIHEYPALCCLHVLGLMPCPLLLVPGCCTDSLWAEGGQDGGPDPDHGLHLLSQAEMLSLDSAMLMVQLNIRLLLEVRRTGVQG